jgi:hypothetical protein
MTRLSAITTALALVGAATFSHGALAQTGTGWTQLFDGKSLEGWNPTGEANWRIEDGAIVADKGKGGFLLTKDKYKNHQIYAEFWADEAANSGIFVRCIDPKTIGARTCYEVNIFDKRPDPTYGTGAVVYFAEVSPMPKAAGKWNTYEITASGRDLTVVLNGQQTAKVRTGIFEEGPFGLQYGSGTIKFRKVAVKPL